MILSAATPVKVRLSSRHNTNNLTLPPSKSLTNNFHYSCNKPNASSSLANESSQNPNPNSNNKELLHQINYSNREDDADNKDLVPSASAIAQTIRNVSNGAHVEFIQRIEIDGKKSRLGSSSPSPEFLSLCSEQLDLFRKIVDRETVLSVYVRPAGSYVMDRLELRRVTFYPGKNVAETAEVVVLIGSFGIPTGLRLAETALSNQQMEVIHERKAVVFPMVKHPFVVGFLVAEFSVEFETHRNVEGDVQDIQFCTPSESYTLPLHSERNRWDLKALKENPFKTFDHFTAEQRSSVINISCSLAMAYVMDQKAMLLQQSYWQNNIRMSDLVEQIRGSLSSIRSLSKMLSIHTKKSEISYDIIEDILVQGDQMGNTLQQLQDAVYLTKANIVRYNEELLRKAKHSKYVHPESGSSQLLDNFHGGIDTDKTIHLQQAFPLSSAAKDSEMPMPPLSLAPLQQHNIRPSDASYVLADLVGAAGPLAHKLQRKLELSEISQSLQVAVEESALRQALSNLIEGALLRTHAGGKVEIVSTGAPAGGVLVVIDDDGPDMHYMTQMHSLTPFGPELFSDGMVEDSMTWNFISGLTVAREILESYGCVLRVISPRIRGAVFGSGGTRIELWFPSPTTTSDSSPQIEGG